MPPFYRLFLDASALEYNVSALDGLVSVGGSASATGGSGVKVHDTSGRAVSDILRRLQ